MGNSCPPPPPPPDCSNILGCDDGYQHASSPSCVQARTPVCPKCPRDYRNRILSEDCQYLLHSDTNEDTNTCLDYEDQKSAKFKDDNLCTTISDYAQAKTWVENGIASETSFVQQIIANQGARETTLDGDTDRAGQDIALVNARIQAKETLWNPVAYCDRNALFNTLLPAVAVIQQNNADVQARVTSRAAAEAAKASYMR